MDPSLAPRVVEAFDRRVGRQLRFRVRRAGRALERDVAPIEVAAWSPLIVLMVALGFAPGLVLWLTDPSVTGWFTELFA